MCPMKNEEFDNIYKNVPYDQKELLAQFRSSHPRLSLTRNGVVWEYISCGEGTETLVLLPGGLGFYEAMFKVIMALEKKFHIITAKYPQVRTMDDLIEGIALILESEHVQKVNLLGVSFGGWLAQCFVRKHPEVINKLILSNTSGPDGFSINQVKIGVASARFLPLGFLKAANKERIMKLISPTDSELEFWKAFLDEEFSCHVTRKDMVCRLQNTLDYMSNYKFSSDDLAEWKGKMLVLESDDDLAFQQPIRNSLKMLYPSAQICTLQNAGHAPSHRGSLEYISAIDRFISQSSDM